uniref:sugar transferase n=1 Tax=Candidatus Fimivicinus sp. TaxID=3056640 RepID=UPI003FEE2D30
MKRFFDFVCSLLAIIILFPILLSLSIVILIDSGRPVIFKQKRVGLNNQLFDICKFRTMKQGTRNAPTAELKEFKNCVTRCGRFLRKTSLDELPQLFNILRGEMSFVGPRPLIPEEAEIRSLREKSGVYQMRPGVTGLAQVNGRDLLTAEQKVAYDAYYVEHHTLVMDIRILLQTVAAVLTGKGFAEGGELRHHGEQGEDEADTE